MRAFKQTERLAAAVEGVESGLIVNDVTPFAAPKPLVNEIAAIASSTGLVRILGIGHLRGQEHPSATAQGDINAIAVGELHELSSNINTLLTRLFGHRSRHFPISIRRVGVGRGGRGVGDAGRGYQTGLHARPFGFLQKSRQFVLLAGRAVATRHFRPHAQHPGAGLVAGDQCRHGAGGIGHLRVYVVGLHQRHVGKLLEGKIVLFPRLTTQLTGEDSRRGDRRDAHAIAHEKDDVGCLGGCLRRREHDCHPQPTENA